MMSNMHVGLADHLGWAVVVTADDEHAVVDRRRIALVEPGVSEAPIHYGRGDATAEQVEAVRASVRRTAAIALDALAAALPGPVATCSLRHVPADFPTDLAVLRRAPWEARADAVMYRRELAALVRARGRALHAYDAPHAETQAAALLGDRVDAVLRGPRAALGPPWTRDHRTALAAAVLAARTGRPRAPGGSA